MTKSALILDCLAAAYRLDLGDKDYVHNLAEAATPLLDRGFGVLAYTYNARDERQPVIEEVATSTGFDPSWLPRFYEAVEAAGYAGPPQPTGFEAWRHMTCGQASQVAKMRPFLPMFEILGGSRDAFALNALDASGQGLWLGAPLRSTRKVSVEQVTLFTRLAAHLASAMRLRRTTSGTKPKAAAVLSPSGALLHAEAEAGVLEARATLREATVAFDQARSKKPRSNVDSATRRWRPLVVSRWSLLDDFDSDGRRFVVAVENAPPTRPPRRDLSEREHQVMTQAHLGHTNKVIAYELGLSTSTVRVLLHRAALKLGVSTRDEAIRRFDQLVQKAQRSTGPR